MSIFDDTALTVFGTPVSWTEVVGDVSGLVTVWLTVRRHVLNWPIGLVNTVFFAILFLQARLYADAGLQVVFFGQGLFGWWAWSRGASPVASSTPVHRTTRTQWVALGVATVVLFAACIAFLHLTDDAAPVRDASVLALSLVATYGQAKALVESWYLWILTDLISIPLYLTQHLYPTALVYGVFLVMCVLGLRGWRRQAARQDELALAA